MTIIIDHDGLESILEDYRDGYDTGMIDCYFCTAAYPPYAQAETQTEAEREAALRAVRSALIEALCGRGLSLQDAVQYVARHEYLTRETMNEVDGLPVHPMHWMSFWPPMRWRHSEEVKQAWNEEA
jgi:uncharacterized NAD(P)/FAD-binding protein YdhS